MPNWLKKAENNEKKLLSHIKIGKENLTFGDIKIENNKCYRYGSPLF